MAYLIGIDEAGYGPNLGPLVVSASLWHVPDRLRRVDLYELLEGVVSASPPRKREAARLPVADSKTLYKSGGGLGALECGVLASAEAAGLMPDTWRGAWRDLAPASQPTIETTPWYAGFDRPLPIDADLQVVRRLADALRHRLADLDVTLVTVRSVAVFAGTFNALLDRLGSKGLIVSKTTMELLGQMLRLAREGPVQVQCDKHGGRNRYAPLLQEAFPEHLIEIHEEGRIRSVYRWGPVHGRIETRFVAKGERFLPTALASMASKYLRELAMVALNAFWQQRVSGLKATAGYPVDARRFHREIAQRQLELGIPDQLLWRNR